MEGKAESNFRCGATEQESADFSDSVDLTQDRTCGTPRGAAEQAPASELVEAASKQMSLALSAGNLPMLQEGLASIAQLDEQQFKQVVEKLSTHARDFGITVSATSRSEDAQAKLVFQQGSEPTRIELSTESVVSMGRGALKLERQDSAQLLNADGTAVPGDVGAELSRWLRPFTRG